MFYIRKIFLFGILLLSFPAIASVIPEYAVNSYTDHSLSRSEKKCIDEGYKITYANCTNQTAPADRCPYHDSYYRSCSQEQWCRNNNFAFLKDDCKLPTYPIKICSNKYPMYRACQEDIAKACEEAGFTSQSKCQLTDKRCPYDSDYGKCCNNCPDFSHAIDAIPEGYVAKGDTCTTCEGIVKTNVEEAPCEDYQFCQFGPLSEQTPSCLKGEKMLYTACKTAEITCREKGFLYTSCQSSEDAEDCPLDSNLKKCKINCYRLATETFPESDIISDDVVDPQIDIAKNRLRSMYGEISKACISNKRPEVTLNINAENMAMYETIFNRTISNVNFILNFEEPLQLPANGNFNNVRIKITGDAPDCPLKGNKIVVSGTVSLMGAANICANIDITDSSKFITTGNITGNVDVGKNSSLGVKGNLLGALKTKSYAEVIIKGILRYNDNANNTNDSESIVLGCNSQAKISGGIIADTSNVVIKQRTLLDVPYIKLISTSNNPDLPNTLASLHLHKYTRLVSIYDETEYPLVANSDDVSCDDKYVVHLGSSIESEEQSLTLEPSYLLEDKWQCKTLSRTQLECD